MKLDILKDWEKYRKETNSNNFWLLCLYVILWIVSAAALGLFTVALGSKFGYQWNWISLTIVYAWPLLIPLGSVLTYSIFRVKNNTARVFANDAFTEEDLKTGQSVLKVFLPGIVVLPPWVDHVEEISLVTDMVFTIPAGKVKTKEGIEVAYAEGGTIALLPDIHNIAKYIVAGKPEERKGNIQKLVMAHLTRMFENHCATKGILDLLNQTDDTIAGDMYKIMIKDESPVITNGTAIAGLESPVFATPKGLEAAALGIEINKKVMQIYATIMATNRNISPNDALINARAMADREEGTIMSGGTRNDRILVDGDGHIEHTHKHTEGGEG